MTNQWSHTTLGELCDLGKARIQTGPFGSQLHSYDYVPVGIPVVPTEAIGRRRIQPEGVPHVSEATAERLSRHKLRPGDILFARRGIQATGLSALVETEHKGWICGTGAILLRFITPDINPSFVSFALCSDVAVSWLKAHAVGAVMPNLNEDVLRRLPLLLPPIRLQTLIAHILGSLDDKIELNRRMNETLEAMARALFKSWFIDFDPVRAKADGRKPEGMDEATAKLFPDSFEESELGQIPSSWQTIPVLDIADLISGGTPSTSNPTYWDGSIPWASAKDVSQCGEAFLIATERTITQDGLFNSATKLIPKFSTVVVARGATTGRFTIFGNDIAMNQTCYAIRDKHNCDFYLNGVFSELVAQLVHSAHGSVFDTITTETFRRGMIVAPGLKLRQSYNATVSPLFMRILTNLIESKSLASLRDALLPKLLSGELRIKDAERFVEAAL